MKILVADDDNEVLKLFDQFLSRHGYEVHVVESGFAAIRKIRSAYNNKQRYDVAILDLFMPMNGLEVAKQTRQLSPETRIIVCTAFPGHKLIQEAISNAEVDKMMAKPVEMSELVKFLKNIKEEVN